jgi:hypothetical protein
VSLPEGVEVDDLGIRMSRGFYGLEWIECPNNPEPTSFETSYLGGLVVDYDN